MEEKTIILDILSDFWNSSLNLKTLNASGDKKSAGQYGRAMHSFPGINSRLEQDVSTEDQNGSWRR